MSRTAYKKINFPSEQDFRELNIPEIIEQRSFLSGGVLHEWNGNTTDVFSPIFIHSVEGYNRLRLGSYPEMEAATMNTVLTEAKQAYNQGRGEWPAMRLIDRISHLKIFLEKMISQRAQIVNLLIWEIGKNRTESEVEFDRTVEYIEDTIEAVKKLALEEEQLNRTQGILAQIRRSPLGVALCMGPYNYPLNETFATLIPALVMGNVVILKPARFGILLLSPLIEAFRDSFPSGVVNIIYGDGKNTAGVLMESGKIDVLAFIGSSRVANILKRQHPYPNRLRSVLGLEAKNPAIIMPDANLDIAVSECVNGTLAFNGQRCTALKIIFIHRSIVNEFLRKFCLAVEELKVGMPWEHDVAITPLPDPEKPAFLKELIDDAVQKGASIINEGGSQQDHSLVYPTILYPVNKQMRIYHEEQLGPVIPILAFEHIDEPIQYILDSNYGQQVSIFCKHPDAIASLINPLLNQVCRININAKCQRGPDLYPFNGRKDSAEGTLSVDDALHEFSIRTMIATRDTDENQTVFSNILDFSKSVSIQPKNK